MQTLYTIEQIRQLEHHAIESGIDGLTMMQRAGQAILEHYQDVWSDYQKISVVCGTGNNGGDGLTLAYLAHDVGYDVQIILAKPIDKPSYEVQNALEACYQRNLVLKNWDEADISYDAVVFDALLGIGCTRALKAPYDRIVRELNQLANPVNAVDVPSGLNADTGCAQPVAVQAQVTVTFIGHKQGLWTADAPDYCGRVICCSLQVPVPNEVSSCKQVVDHEQLLQQLPKRRANSHKGDYGHVVIVGGNRGMPGSVKLAALGAAGSGAGLVTIATHPRHADFLVTDEPYLMCHGVDNAQHVQPLIEQADAVVLGPGLGQDAWAQQMFDTTLGTVSRQKLVIDADGLRLLAQQPRCLQNAVLTPHPGEAAALLGIESAATIQQDRFAYVRDIQQRYQSIVLLKGTGTLIDDGRIINVSTYGDPAMASAGMGDLLSGMIAGLYGQKRDLMWATTLAASAHGFAGCQAAVDRGELGVVATDLLDYLPVSLNLDEFQAYEETAYLMSSPENAQRLNETIEQIQRSDGI